MGKTRSVVVGHSLEKWSRGFDRYSKEDIQMTWFFACVVLVRKDFDIEISSNLIPKHFTGTVLLADSPMLSFNPLPSLHRKHNYSIIFFKEKLCRGQISFRLQNSNQSHSMFEYCLINND